MKTHPFLLLLMAGIMPVSAVEMDLTSTSGKSISVDVLSHHEGKISFKKIGNDKVFNNFDITKFDADSQKRIKEATKDLAPPFPELELNLSVGKVRDKNTFHRTERITSKLLITNTDNNMRCPKFTAYVMHFAKDIEKKKEFVILANESFTGEIGGGGSFSRSLKEFENKYGLEGRVYTFSGASIGYKHDGYAIILMDSKDNIVTYKTTVNELEDAYEGDWTLLKELVKLKEETVLTPGFKKHKKQGRATFDGW